MNSLRLSVIAMFFVSFVVAAGTDLVNVKSPHSVNETANRFETGLKAKGMTVFSRIDHAAAAQKLGLHFARLKGF